MSKTTAWPQEHTNRLPYLVADGLSASQIAAEIGVTRNAVIGKIHRLGLRLHGSLGGRPPKPRPPKPSLPVGNRPTGRPTPTSPVLTARLVPRLITLADLDMTRDCRFPASDDAPQRYCGLPREFPGDDGIHVYCPFHARIAYNERQR